MRVLLLDADRGLGRTLEPELNGTELHSAQTLSEGLRLIAHSQWDLILLDVEFSGGGMELLGRLHQDGGPTPVVLLAENPSMDLAMEAIRQGAHDVLPKPVPRGRVREILLGIEEVRRLRPLPTEVPDESTIVGTSQGMMSVYKSVARAANSDATVLVLGESGTGKELVARAHPPRSRARARAVRGHQLRRHPREPAGERALRAREGRLHRRHRAHGSAASSAPAAARCSSTRSATCRWRCRPSSCASCRSARSSAWAATTAHRPWTCASWRPPTATCARPSPTARFREDLYYRLAVVTLQPAAAARARRRHGPAGPATSWPTRPRARPAAIRAIAEEVFGALRLHPWPGNVRQLRNAMERAVVMSDGEVLLPHHLPPDILHPPASRAAAEDPGEMPLVTLEEMEKRMIRRALRETQDNLTMAAERLGIHRNTLRRKIAEYEIEH